MFYQLYQHIKTNLNNTTVEKIEKVVHNELITVYNFEVEDFHTYFVSDVSVLVHNNGCQKNKSKVSKKGTLKINNLPTKGKIRYVPSKSWSSSQPLPKRNGGYVDKFGNVWTKEPSRTAGQSFEWDVQLFKTGKKSLGWASRDESHLNVSLDGKITHKQEVEDLFIRAFIYSNSKDEAQDIFESIIESVKDSIKNKEYIENKPYWKIEGIYVVEVKILFDNKFNKSYNDKLLKSICDKWITYGNPIEEVLACDDNEGCNFIKNGLKMINIFY